MYLSFICRGVARKHFTALLHYLCNHPYLEKYALPRPLKPDEKTARNNAIAIVVHSLYHVLWSFRCKFFNIRRKSKLEGLRMNVKAPQNAWTPDALMKLEQAINMGIRGLASARRARLHQDGDDDGNDDDNDEKPSSSTKRKRSKTDLEEKKVMTFNVISYTYHVIWCHFMYITSHVIGCHFMYISSLMSFYVILCTYLVMSTFYCHYHLGQQAQDIHYYPQRIVTCYYPSHSGQQQAQEIHYCPQGIVVNCNCPSHCGQQA